MEQIIKALAQDLEDRGNLDLSEYFVDGRFVPAKIRGIRINSFWCMIINRIV